MLMELNIKRFLMLFVMISVFSNALQAQVEKSVDKVIDGVSEGVSNIIKLRSPFTSEKPFGKKTKDKEVQTISNLSLISEGKYQKIAGSLYVKFGEDYPKPYMPEWDFTFHKAKIIKETIASNRTAQLKETFAKVSISEYEGKAIVLFKPDGYYGLFTFLMAEIELPKNKIVYVSEISQTFDLDEFKQITFDENDGSIKVLRKDSKDYLSRNDESGKWVGQIILKCDKTGNIVVELGYIIHGSGNRAGANYKAISNGLVFKNIISKEKALNLKASNRCLSGDCENGIGSALIDSCNYEGAFLRGKPDGKGKKKFKNGDLYVGDFREGKLHGSGEYYHADGRYYKGSFTAGKINGVGIYNRYGLTEISFWENGNKGYSKGFSKVDITKHQDSVFAKFKKCDCLSKSKYTTLGFGMDFASRAYVDNYGTIYETSPELEITPKFGEASCLQNTTSGNIYVRAIRKITTENNEEAYFDESYIIEPNGQVSEDMHRINSFFGGASYSTDFIVLGQYCEQNSSPCSLFESDDNIKKKFEKQGVSYTVGAQGLKTNKQITSGSKIYVIANGSMRLGTFAGASGPGGKNGFDLYSKVSKCKHGALMLRIGNSELYCVGNQLEITAKNTGKLEFLINDNDYTNNSGEFEVQILVVK